MFYNNQNNYGELIYASKTHPNATIKTSGCGVVSCAIAINNLFNKQVYSVQQMRDFALKSGARVNEGTDVNILLKALCKAHNELSFKTTNDENALVTHLKNGGMAIANQGDNYNVFSTAGHFVVCESMVGNNINVLDPQMYDGKYSVAPRPNRIVKKTEYGCVVSTSEIAKATQDRSPAYFLITYNKPKPTPSKPKTYANGCDVADYYNEKYGDGKNYKVAASSLNIRMGADTSKKSLAILPNGTKLRWYGYYSKDKSKDNWFYVKVIDGKYKGVVGYVKGLHIKAI